MKYHLPVSALVLVRLGQGSCLDSSASDESDRDDGGRETHDEIEEVDLEDLGDL